MPERRPAEAALSYYHDLAEQLQAGRLSPDAAAVRAQQMAGETLPAPATIERLRAEAETEVVHSPRRAWALAHVALAAAKHLAGELLEAECTLALTVALNALGRFAEAVPLLRAAAERFLAHGRQDLAGRCYSELAMACSYQGQFEDARAALSFARDILAGHDDPLARAYCDRAEGLFHLEQNRYHEAAALLSRAGDAFAAAGRQDEAALIWCDLAITLRYIDGEEALNSLEKARRVPAPGSSPVHAARCDYVQAVIYEELNRYAESLILCRQARAVSEKQGLDFLVALCDQYQGIAHYRLNQYDEALQAYSRARDHFVAQALSTHVARCDLNVAVVLYAMNRYAEALTLYRQVAEEALAEGRTLRAARCHTNMGLCYDRLGRYDRALVLHDRARQAFLEADSPVYAALCQENLAGTYRRLGRYAEALEHYRQAREAFAAGGMPVYVARCDTHRADLYLALGRHAEALTCLEQARATCQQAGMAVHVAACEREMARVRAEMGRADDALASVDRARAVFTANELLVDAALCDLAAGEVNLSRGETATAASLFTAALEVLAPGFPDEAWRARYGLGRCALIQGDRRRGLEHWLSAVELTARVRAILPTEQLSGGFFASRRQLYEGTLRLALELGAEEQALTVAEAGKTQTSLVLQRRPAQTWAGDWGWRGVAQADDYLADLLNREATLRQEMASLRHKLRLLEVDEAGPVLRGESELRGDQPQALARLAELARAYEKVVERLRLVTPGWFEAHAPVAFSVPELRQAIAACLPTRWACLSYYLLDGTLITFYLDPQQLNVHSRPLNTYDRLALRQCTEPAADFRELIYRGSIRGHPAPHPLGRTYLQHLFQLLIPPEARGFAETDLLIVAPHGPLHGLAFQALLDDAGRPLVSRVPLTTVPSLSTFQSLLREATEIDAVDQVLACGLSDFDARATPLPHAVKEIAAIRDVLGERLHVLWGAEATRETLLGLNESGDLVNYDVIHFATHAVLDHLAPSQSRVLLADDSLTVADILNLRLGARMVVLSACEGAIGKRHPGDEIMGLARAFFLAGARTVVAGLWPVEDAAAGEFMGRFYGRLVQGEGVAGALRAVQVEMAEAGCVPYQWAPF
ncbi:MAG: CHAT domain-containing protein, partial [Anaerolineae bacterium]